MIALNRVDLPLPLTPTERGDRARRDLEGRIAQGGVAVAVGDGRVL